MSVTLQELKKKTCKGFDQRHHRLFKKRSEKFGPDLQVGTNNFVVL